MKADKRCHCGYITMRQR